MPQHLLHRAQISPTLQQMSREAVPQGVGRDPLADPRVPRPGLNDAPGSYPRERLAPRVEQYPVPGPAAVEPGPDLVKVDGNRSDHLPTDRDQPLLRTLTQNANQAFVEPEVVQRKPAQLGDPQPGAVPKLQEGSVPPRQRLLDASGGKDGLHVRHSERIGKFPSSLRSLEPVGGIDRHKPFANEETEVGPHSRNLAPNRSRAEAEVFQGENEIAQKRPGDSRGTADFTAHRVLSQTVEIPQVVLDGVGAAAGLEAQVVPKPVQVELAV